MRKIILSTAILIVLSADLSVAQDSLKVLNEVVITATRSGQEIIDVARSVEVISEKEIRESTYSSVGELLSRKTATYVVGATQTPGTNQDIFMRGANSNHVIILIDGVRVTDPSSPNNAFNLAELSLANVERIELVYGAHSSLYGTAAIGGTINIITKKAKQGFDGYGSIQGGVLGEGGQFLEGSGNVSYGFENGIYISGSVFRQGVKGIDASIDTVTSNNFKTSDRDGFLKTDFSVKAGYRNPKWDNFIEYKSVDQKADIDDGPFNDDDNYFVDLNRDFLNYRLSRSFGKWDLTLSGGYTFSQREAINDSSVIDKDNIYNSVYFSSAYQGQVMTNEALLSYKSENMTTIFGAGDYREAMDFNTYYYSNSAFGPFEAKVDYDSLDISSTIQYLFIAGNFVPFDPGVLNISYGVRYNHHNNFGNHLTFEINPSYKIGRNGRVFLSFAKGFNAPSLYQQYDPTPGIVTTRGNRDLLPEVSTSLEVGWKQYITSDIAFTLSYFNNRVRDAIEYVYLWNGETPQDELSYADYLGDMYVNINEQNIQGLETSLNGSLTPKFNFYFNATLLKTRVNTTTGEQIPEVIGNSHVQVYSNGIFVSDQPGSGKLVRRPSAMASAGTGYTLNEGLRLHLDYRYIGGRYDAVYDPSLGPFGALGTLKLDAFHLLNLSGNYRFSESFTAFITIKNLLNERYNEIRGYNSLGRSVHMKLVYEF